MTTLQQYQCIKKTYDEIVLSISIGQSGITDLSRQTFLNAKNAGLRMSISICPCRAASPDKQAGQIIKKLGGPESIERVWIYPHDLTSVSCQWKNSAPEFNCVYLQQMVSALRSNGFNIGIAGIESAWPQYFGSTFGCREVGHQLLAWIPSNEHQDHQPSLTPFYPLGSWQRAYLKYFGSANVCGANYYNNYYE